jgi:hypothetical protein
MGAHHDEDHNGIADHADDVCAGENRRDPDSWDDPDICDAWEEPEEVKPDVAQ